MLQGSHWSLEASEGAGGSGHPFVWQCTNASPRSPKSHLLRVPAAPWAPTGTQTPQQRTHACPYPGVLGRGAPAAGKSRINLLNLYSKPPEQWIPEQCSRPPSSPGGLSSRREQLGCVWRWPIHSHHRPGACWLFGSHGQGVSVSPGPPAPHTPTGSLRSKHWTQRSKN